MDSVVVSIRIKKDLKATLEKEGIDVEQDVKEYLNQKAKRIALRKTIERATQILKSNKVKPSKKGWAVRTIRHDRYVVH
jgi:hypothetical protein